MPVSKVRHNSYPAGSAVETGLVRALVLDPVLAVLAGVAGRAGAGIGSLAGVQAGGAVHAGRVVGAVVEVLVAEEAAPAGAALALVGLGAHAVLAARVPLAPVALVALPALTTPGGTKQK